MKLLILVFIFLFSFSDQSLLSGLLNIIINTAGTCPPKADNIDEVAAQLFAFGDPCHSFPTDYNTAADLCAKYRNWTAAIDASLSPNLIRAGLTSMYYLSASTVCQLYEQNANIMIEFAKEVNSKVAKLNPARERILDLGYALSQVLSALSICIIRSGFSNIACLIFQWAAATTNELSVSSQVIANQIFAGHLKIATLFTPLPICVSLPLRLTNTAYASIDMNFVFGTKNCMVGL